ncbi:hypothetical protein Poli38472_002552 [Pythium oligandrum]|uniref:Mitochondrial protein n=1 Tax=Pythium oligandrum TaxID=41045 RepID=A0A8K1CIY8_PYTOL|nr:hypothetical protein Poli38472_002552 [Pythium oligandrum]|eukprot:TMW63611.1 hypothetical protein Poli38472_002552 [Pythium oligandrum]
MLIASARISARSSLRASTLSLAGAGRILPQLGYDSVESTSPFQVKRTFNTSAPLQFDTHRVVKKLQDEGFSAVQAEAILEVMKDSMAESLEAQARVLATKSEHVELKAELSERVFNSTLKFDIAQRHMRELLERDFNNLKQDIRMLEKLDFDKVRMEIAELEKKFLLQKQAEDETLNDLRLSMEKVEKRMLQYAVGFAGTIMAVGAALMRLVL